MAMAKHNVAFRALVAFGVLAFVSGCYTVELSDTTHPEERTRLRGGPGARQGELVRIVRFERTHYSGERVSFGLFPGLPCVANDFGGWSGYVPAATMTLILGPFVNAFELGIPTLCTLFVEPFTKTSEKRGDSWDSIAMGFVGTYRWRVLSHDETEFESVEEVLVDGGYRPELGDFKISRAADGTKVWHGYPGFQALWRDVERDGKVDVMSPDGRLIRRFRKSKLTPGYLSFEDRTGDK